MDIFAIANEGMKIQEQEKKDALIEAQAVEKEKNFKLDIFLALEKIAQKDYGWLGRDDQMYTSEEKIKGFQPFIANMFLSKAVSPNKTRSITAEDEGYADIIQRVNTELNTNVFWVSKEMSWLMACTINPFDMKKINMDRITAAKKGVSSKYDKRVIKYMANELWSSETKIMEMIDAGLIDADDMKAIGKDLDTLEK